MGLVGAHTWMGRAQVEVADLAYARLNDMLGDGIVRQF